MPRRLLVVVTAPDPEDELLEHLRRIGGEGVEIMVVAPASDLSFKEWLVGDDDLARAEAERKARKAATAGAVAGKVVEARVGEPDPLVAIEDALRTFPADELVVVTRPGDAATWLEKDAVRASLEHLGLPLIHLVDDDLRGLARYAKDASQPAQPSVETVEDIARAMARGRSPWIVQAVVFLSVVFIAAFIIATMLVLYYKIA